VQDKVRFCGATRGGGGDGVGVGVGVGGNSPIDEKARVDRSCRGAEAECVPVCVRHLRDVSASSDGESLIIADASVIVRGGKVARALARHRCITIVTRSTSTSSTLKHETQPDDLLLCCPIVARYLPPLERVRARPRPAPPAPTL
jgi:hypothetical protein